MKKVSLKKLNRTIIGKIFSELTERYIKFHIHGYHRNKKGNRNLNHKVAGNLSTLHNIKQRSNGRFYKRNLKTIHFC